MFDSHIRPHIDPPLNCIAKALAGYGVSANAITFLGFGFALCCFAALSFGLYWFAVLFVVLNRLMDGLDGPLSRQTQATDLGGYLDIVFDFIFYAGVIFFFAVGFQELTVSVAMAAAFLIFSFMGTSTSFLAYAIIATKRGENHEEQGKKAFFYAQGLAEGTETVLVLLLICILPDQFVPIAYVYGFICWLTTFGRTMLAYSSFKD